MRIIVRQEPDLKETQISIACSKMDSQLEEIISTLSLIDNTIAGKCEKETFFIFLSDVLYFETVDNKMFFYSTDKIYETPLKVYQLEEKLADTPFVRVSKSVILNIKKVKSIKREENSRLMATLINGEKIIVSRQYMHIIKNKLGV